MKQLNRKDYPKIIPLIQSQNELTVFAVLEGKVPGKVYADDENHPTAAFLRFDYG